MTLSMYPHPGKFEGELALAPFAHNVSLDGGNEEYDFGNDCVDLYVVCHGTLELTPGEIEEAGLTDEDVAFANNLLGFIVHENDQGFVSVSWYEKGEEVQMAKAVGKLDTAMGKFEREHEEIDG